MREIKFRHFNTEDGHFDHFTLAEIDGDGMFPTKRGKARLSHYADELEQYTGLKDRNGVEIYEGDILADGSEVRWFADGWWAVAANSNRHADRLCAINAGAEVIGNIHETPDAGWLRG